MFERNLKAFRTSLKYVKENKGSVKDLYTREGHYVFLRAFNILQIFFVLFDNIYQMLFSNVVKLK